MATTLPVETIGELPDEMIAAAIIDAARDADGAIAFLKHLGIQGSRERPLSLPPSFLLHLATGIRLLIWESEGFAFHREASLPDALTVIVDAFTSIAAPEIDGTELGVAVTRLSLERFAWRGQIDLKADIALDDVTDDAALDALAELLWEMRRAEPGAQPSER